VAIAGSVVKICSRVASVREEGGEGQWRPTVKRSGAAESGVGVEVLPVTTAPLTDRIRVRNYRWGKWRQRTSSCVPQPPTSPFIAQRDRGPPTDQGAGSRPNRALGLLVGRSN
jgi:hypothetical protein